MGLFDDIFKKKDIHKKVIINGKEVDINPNASVYSQSGLVKYEQGDYSGAVTEFTKAINAQPSNQNFFLMRGTAYEKLGNDNEAEIDFLKTLEIHNTDYLASFRLGMLYFKKKDIEKAVKCLSFSYKYAPSGDLSSAGFSNGNIIFVHKKIIAGNLGNFLTQLKQFEEGFKYLDEAIKLDPKYHNPYMAKGMAYAQMGKPIEGIHYLKEAMKLGNPQAEMAIKMLEQQAQQTSQEEEENEELALEFVFHSSNQLRYENDIQVSGPISGARRAVQVEPNISGNEGYTVTIFNTDSEQAVVQMAPKQMKFFSADNYMIQLKGYGCDAMGASFGDYGLTIYHNDGKIVKCFLHLFDRNIDIEYLP